MDIDAQENINTDLFADEAGSLYIRCRRRPAKPKVTVSSDYVIGWPSDLPPVIVGIPIDDGPQPRHILSDIFHLARRVALIATEDEKKGWFCSKADFQAM